MTESANDHDDASVLHPGQRVEVWSRYDREWSRGFEVAEVVDGGYRLRRLSDGDVLPRVFTRDDIRRERRRETWWI